MQWPTLLSIRRLVLASLIASVWTVASSAQSQETTELINKLLARIAALETQLGEARKDAEVLRDVLAKSGDPMVIHVAAGGDLQAALDKIPVGGTVTLDPGVVYSGNYTIAKSLTLTTVNTNFGRRVTPGDAPQLAYLQSATTDVVKAVIELVPSPTTTVVTLRALRVSGPSNELVQCGRGDHRQTTLEQQPRGIVFDQLYVHGDTTAGAKRGIALNCADAVVTRSHISGIRRAGQDSQAIAGYNGTGPFLIEDNYLEAASENILFGGADPAIPGLLTRGIVIRGNHITKDLAWRTQSVNVKTAIELKEGVDVLIEGNLIENVWLASQIGWALTFTPSQYGANPNVQIADVVVRNNHIRRVGGGINLLGHSQHNDRPSARTERITFSNNWFQIDHKAVVDGRVWGGTGSLIQVQREPADLVIENNTVEQTGTRIIIGDGPPVTGFRFVGNLVRTSGTYGITVRALDGTSQHYGTKWREFFPAGVIEGNAFADFPRPANLPGNLHLPAAQVEIVEGRGAGAVAAYGRRNP